MIEPRLRERTLLAVGMMALSGFVVAVVMMPAATRYRADLYGALSPLGWIAFAVAVICGLVVIYSAARRGSHRWLFGTAVVLGTYAAFFWLPVARGYVLYATPLADSLFHLGVVKDVLRFGTAPDVIYPASHLLIASLVEITRLPRTLFQPLLGYTFTLLLVLGMFVSARRLFRSHTGGLYALLAALPLVYAGYHVVVLPWFYALSLFPLMLFLADRWLTGRGSRRLYVVLFVFMVTITFYHPMVSLFTVSLLVSYWAYLWIESSTAGQSVRGNTVSALFFLLLVPLAVITEWHLNLTRMQSRIVTIILAFTQGDQSAASFAGQAGQTSYTLFELVWRFLVLRWGPTVIYLSLASLILIAIGYRIWRQRTTATDHRVVMLYLVGFLTAIVALVILRTSNPVRAARFALLMAIYVLALELWHRHRVDKNSDRWHSRAVAHGLLVVIVVVALLAGGITYRGDAHLTQTTVEGTTWHLEHENTAILTQSHRMSRNLDIYQNGYRRALSHEPTFTRYNASYQLPKHLGYDENETIATTLAGRRYLVTKYSDTQWYRNQPKSRYPGLLFYNQSDAAELATDPAANRLYTNGNFSVWLAEG